MDVPYSLSAYTRVLRMASTPAWPEFKQVATVAAGGIALIGSIGFVIYTAMSLFHWAIGL